MQRSVSTSVLVFALALSACSGNSTVSENSASHSISSSGVRIEVVGAEHSSQNVLAGGSSSATDVGIAGYQVQANQMFVSKYSGMQPSFSAQNMQNGSINGSVSYDANGNVISTNGSLNGSFNGSANANARYDANGNPINRNGVFANGSSSSRRANQTQNNSAYSYIAGCDYSVLGSLGMSATCGDNGYLFPGLIGGQCPVSACMFNVDQGGKTPFGPL